MRSLAPRRRPLGAHRADEYAAGVARPNSSAAMTKADEPILSNYVRSAPEQGGNHCAVGPAHPGLGCAAGVPRVVAQDQDLDLLGGFGSRAARSSSGA